MHPLRLTRGAAAKASPDSPDRRKSLSFGPLIVHARRRLGYARRVGGREAVFQCPIEGFFRLAPLFLAQFLGGFLAPLFLDLILSHAVVWDSHSVLSSDLAT